MLLFQSEGSPRISDEIIPSCHCPSMSPLNLGQAKQHVTTWWPGLGIEFMGTSSAPSQTLGSMPQNFCVTAIHPGCSVLVNSLTLFTPCPRAPPAHPA